MAGQRTVTAPCRDSGDEATRLRRLMLVIRQACYFIADEMGKEYGMERPCKRCERLAPRRADETGRRVD